MLNYCNYNEVLDFIWSRREKDLIAEKAGLRKEKGAHWTLCAIIILWFRDAIKSLQKPTALFQRLSHRERFPRRNSDQRQHNVVLTQCQYYLD